MNDTPATTLGKKMLLKAKMNALINNTPTGELRNVLTEINILHLSIVDELETKITKAKQFIEKL